MKVDVYTDGTHLKGTENIGYGAWLEHDGIEYSLSGSFTQNHFKKEFSIEGNVSNPTMELLAVLKVLKEFENMTVDITVYSDYIGVQKWISGEWKAKKPYIKCILAQIKTIVSNVKGKISFKWIKAHSGNYGNDKVDSISKSKDNWNTIKNIPNLN